MPAPSTRYTNVAIALHWVIAALIIWQIAGGLLMVKILPPGSSLKFELYQWHKSFGITILLLSVIRLGWRITHRPPALPDGMTQWERRGAKFSHIAFYALMIGAPLGGWALVSASPYAASVPTYLFGVIPWPHLPFFEGIVDREALTAQFARSHFIGGMATLGLLGMHVAAALKHHYVNKDNVLTRMIPFLSPRS